VIRAGDTIPNGWFWDGEQQCYHDGTGNFYIAGQWYARPDLLAAQPFPAPPTLADKARMEKQRLMTPWPSYTEAWKEEKARKSKARRWAKWGWLLVLPALSAIATAIDEGGQGQESSYFPLYDPTAWFMLLLVCTIPFAAWKVYYNVLKRRDTHKAAAFAVASYAVLKTGTSALANEGHPFRSTRDRFMNEAQRLTGN
jgi:hypothetical protein